MFYYFHIVFNAGSVKTTQRLIYCLSGIKSIMLLFCTAVAVFVAMHVCLRVQLLNHSGSVRMNRANGVAVFERSPIRYNTALNLLSYRDSDIKIKGMYLATFDVSMLAFLDRHTTLN